METPTKQNELETPIGTIDEQQKLLEKEVEIKSINIETVGQKNAKKVVFSCKHPDRDEVINISSMKYEKDGKLVTTGTWYNLDKEDKLGKNSALVKLLSAYNCFTINGMIGKTVGTVFDDNNYLAFKVY